MGVAQEAGAGEKPLETQPDAAKRSAFAARLGVTDDDVKTGKAKLAFTLDGREIQRVSEEVQRSPDVTITRKIPLADFTPGNYSVQTTYTDAASGERFVSTGQFVLK